MKKRSLVMVFDIEPMPRHDVAGTMDEWDAFPRCVQWLSDWRGRLADVTGQRPRFGWALRMDDQIGGAYGTVDWLAGTYQDVFSELGAEGDYFGLHPHAYRREGGGWHQVYDDPRWLEERVATWIDAFSLAFGKAPEFHRFGDHWLSNGIVRVLQQKGVGYDLTMEPGRPPRTVHAPDRGRDPDYRTVPREPYQPDPSDFLRRGRASRRDIWLMPLTTACMTRPDTWHRDEHKGHEPTQLNLAMAPERMRPLLNISLRGREMVLTVARTGDLSHTSCLAAFKANCEFLWTHPHMAGYVIEGPAEALRRFQANRCRSRPPWLQWLGRIGLRGLGTG